MTVQDLITSSLRLVNAVASGEPPTTDELADALQILNLLLDESNAQHLAVYQIVNRQFPLAAATASYTIGSGGAFSVPRPVKIESAGIIQANGLRSDLELIDSRKWAHIPEKTLQAKQPLQLYNDNAWPLAKLYLWPVPSGAPTLDLEVWQQLSQVALADTLSLPPAYAKALRYNLAVELAAEYARPVDPVVMSVAQASKQEIGQLNQSNFAATEDPPQPAPKAA